MVNSIAKATSGKISAGNQPGMGADIPEDMVMRKKRKVRRRRERNKRFREAAKHEHENM